MQYVISKLQWHKELLVIYVYKIHNDFLKFFPELPVNGFASSWRTGEYFKSLSYNGDTFFVVNFKIPCGDVFHILKDYKQRLSPKYFFSPQQCF